MIQVNFKGDMKYYQNHIFSVLFSSMLNTMGQDLRMETLFSVNICLKGIYDLYWEKKYNNNINNNNIKSALVLSGIGKDRNVQERRHL